MAWNGLKIPIFGGKSKKLGGIISPKPSFFACMPGAEAKAAYQCSGEGKQICDQQLLDSPAWPRPPRQGGKRLKKETEVLGWFARRSPEVCQKPQSPLPPPCPWSEGCPRRTWECSGFLTFQTFSNICMQPYKSLKMMQEPKDSIPAQIQM